MNELSSTQKASATRISRPSLVLLLFDRIGFLSQTSKCGDEEKRCREVGDTNAVEVLPENLGRMVTGLADHAL